MVSLQSAGIGFYSRRINIQHRLVYEVYVKETVEDDAAYEGIVKVARMWTHISLPFCKFFDIISKDIQEVLKNDFL